MTDWVALGRTRDGVRAMLISGTACVADQRGESEAEALAGMEPGDAPRLRIGDGMPSGLPAPILPEGGRSLPGFAQERPPDAIGAWVRVWLAGFLATREGWDGVVCAVEAGISHWLHISAGEVVSAQSFLSLRLSAALSGASEADAEAVADSMSRPERLAAHLRAAEVSGNGSALTGHLIGAELAAARVYWLGQQVAVIAPAPSPHATALEAQGVPVEMCDPEALVVPGLVAIGEVLGFTR